MERTLKILPKEAFSSAPPIEAGRPPKTKPGGLPSEPQKRSAALPPVDDATPRNYGYNPFGSGTNQGTVYHYTDSLVLARTSYPYSATGHFAFTAADGKSYRCSASLISRAILATAGHCVHQGGNGASGWIKGGIFVPARAGNSWPYGYAWANYLVTTSGWYNTGSLDAGYDVALVVLYDRAGHTLPPGHYTGWYGYCAAYCLQSYWYLTQLGYPANYYSGLYLTQGEHLETNRRNTDFYHGSGMQGGSSGGPHVANLGYLSDSTSFLGLWPYRNYVFAVTSWGFVSNIYKIQGASSLSGPNNSNNFGGMWKLACDRARLLHGSSTC